MRKNSLPLVIIIVVLFLTSLACGFSASTANIKDAYMAADDAGVNKTTVFAQDSTFWAIVTLANAPDDTTLKAVWYAVDAENTDPNFMIDEISTTSGDGLIPFSLVNDGPWPLGTYKVDLYLNDKLEKTLEFSVE
jgi:hypothetical protein